MAIISGEKEVMVRAKENGDYSEYAVDLSKVMLPIDGDPAGKHLLSITQLNETDFMDYIREAKAA